MSPPTAQMPRRRTDVILRDEETRSLIVVPDQDRVHVLNPTARALWELCDGTTTLEELTAAICELFDVAQEQATADVSEALRLLEENELMVRPDQPENGGRS
jgi:hypothetical protein